MEDARTDFSDLGKMMKNRLIYLLFTMGRLRGPSPLFESLTRDNVTLSSVPSQRSPSLR